METPLLYPECDFAIWFRSINENNLTEKPIAGRIIGTIPEWINGSLYQNGPGLLDVTGRRVQHLFDAFALIQKFTIVNGCVTYQNRILQSDAYRQASLTGRRCFSEYGTSKSQESSNRKTAETKSTSTLTWLHARLRNLLNYQNEFRTDNAMISIYPYKESNNKMALYTMTETPIMHEIDPVTIETRSKFNVNDHLPIVSHCAHPIIIDNGTVLNIGMASSVTGMQYVLIEFPGSSNSNEINQMKQCKILAKIPSRWPFNPSYIHTFAVTEHYIILVEQCLCISLVQMAKLAITHGPLTDALVWHGTEPVQFRLIDRISMREYTKYTYLTAAFFFLHIINAYEDQNHLVIDICCYKNADMLKCLTIEALENAQQNSDYKEQFHARPKRFVLPLQPIDCTNSVQLNYTTSTAKLIRTREFWLEPETIVDVGCELAQIEYFKMYGKFYRFFYAINTDVDYEYCGAIRKIDILSKTYQIWHEPGCYTSEPIFLRRHSDDATEENEDDGVLIMSLLRSENEREVSLLILDAHHMNEIGRVQFDTNGPVPKCLHGLWVDSTVEKNMKINYCENI